MPRDDARGRETLARGWRVVIVDDEAPAIKRLSTLIRDTGDFAVVATYTDPVDALAALRAMRSEIELDVLFLDIRMPGLTGLELAAALGERASGEAAPLVVFVTAFDEHAIHAFELNAADYLLKPIERARFVRTMERLRERLTARALSRESNATPSSPQSRDAVISDSPAMSSNTLAPVTLQAQIEAVLHSLRQLPPSPSATPTARIALRTRERTTLIDPMHIDRVDADGNTIHIQARRDRYAVRETLTSFAERLPAGCFLRVNRSTLVRIDHVRHVEPWIDGDYTLILADGHKVTSGRTYRDGVRVALALG